MGQVADEEPHWARGDEAARGREERSARSGGRGAAGGTSGGRDERRARSGERGAAGEEKRAG